MHAIKCNHCGVVIESKSQHHFVEHTCDGIKYLRGPDGMIAVDGADVWNRILGEPDDYTVVIAAKGDA